MRSIPNGLMRRNYEFITIIGVVWLILDRRYFRIDRSWINNHIVPDVKVGLFVGAYPGIVIPFGDRSDNSVGRYKSDDSIMTTEKKVPPA